MICHSCGASSKNTKVCDYCGASVVIKNLDSVLKPIDSERAKNLELNEELSYIFDDENNTEQVILRILEHASICIENAALKKAEFLSRLGLMESESDERILLLSAKIKILYATQVAGSIQAANIKQKYILDAKNLLNKINSPDLEDDKKEVVEMIDVVDGKEANAYSHLPPEERTNAEAGEGCISIIVGIVVILAMIGYFIESFQYM
ncbi:hypothetical protein N9F35_01885 [Gammaproteobacteria bacterium]|nr:hypothetical protein [Gammaproteobacteria bacterium]